jgi:hypothetical protein
MFGCQKEVDPTNEGVIDHGGFDPSERSAIIELDKPLDGSYINHGETLEITGNIIANFNMHGYRLTIAKHDELVLDKIYHIHGSNFEISHNWTNNLNSESMLTINITVVGNHYGSLNFEKELVVFAYGEN